MGNNDSFKEFLSTSIPSVDLFNFSTNLILTFLLTYVLARLYILRGKSFSNRKLLADVLIPIGMTTMIIITVVKSSLALSLGLVGALSIVRFRTPIKEPEELVFIFLSIAIGLALGAGQRGIIVIGFIITIVVIWFRGSNQQALPNQMFLSISCNKKIDGLLDKITSILRGNASSITLKRLDTSDETFQSDFYIDIDEYEKFSEMRKELEKIDPEITISFFDNRN